MMEACLEKVKAETVANQKEMKGCLEEAGTCLKRDSNPEEAESVVEQQEVPKEGATVKTVRALKKQYGDLSLAIGRH
jgi:hypothetical protein